MPLYLRLVALALAVVFLMVFVSLIRKRSTDPFVSFMWLVITLLMFSTIVFEKFYKWVATKIGLTDASFLIEVGVIFFLLVCVLYLSIKVSEMSDRIQELISYTSILEKRTRDRMEK